MTDDSHEHPDPSHVQSNDGGRRPPTSAPGSPEPRSGDAPLPEGPAHPPVEPVAAPERSAKPEKVTRSRVNKIVVTPIAAESHPELQVDPTHRFSSLDPAARTEALDAYGGLLWAEALRKRTGRTTRRQTVA